MNLQSLQKNLPSITKNDESRPVVSAATEKQASTSEATRDSFDGETRPSSVATTSTQPAIAPPTPGVSSSPRQAPTPPAPEAAGIHSTQTSAFTRLTRKDMQSPTLQRKVANHLAAEHLKVTHSMHPDASQKPLYVLEDARGRLNNVLSSSEKRQACSLDLQSIKKTFDLFEPELMSASRHRVYGDYNYYPGILSLDDKGDIVSHLDNDNVGWHSPFEIINRFGFLSRLDFDGLHHVADAYAKAIYSRPVTDTELKTHEKVKYIFDLLYYLYFVDTAFRQKSSDEETGAHRAQSLKQAKLMELRVQEDFNRISSYDQVIPNPSIAS